jgi:hypothetical protein
MARRSKTLLLCPVAVVLQIFALAVVMVLLYSGKGAFKGKVRNVPNEYIAFVSGLAMMKVVLNICLPSG